MGETGGGRSTGVLVWLHKLTLVGIEVALIEGLRRRDPSVLLNGVLSLAFARIPGRLTGRFDVRLRPWQRLWVAAAGFVHTAGLLGPYDRVWWWDHLAHLLSGAVVGGTVDVALQAAAERGHGHLSGRTRALAILGTTLGLGVVWELLEYGVHAVADRVGFEPVLVHYGRRDTALDLVFDALAAALVIVFGRRALANVVDSLLAE